MPDTVADASGAPCTAPGEAVPAVEIAAELEAMVRAELTYRENLEPLAARIGLSADATRKTVEDCSRRLRALTFAWWHFEAMARAGLSVTKP